MKRLADRLASPPPTAWLGYSSSPANYPTFDSSHVPSGLGRRTRVASLGDQLAACLPAQCLQKTKIATGTYVTRAGGAMKSLYLLDAGSVKVEYNLPNGQNQVLKFLNPGDLFGHDGVASSAHCFDRIALTDSVAYRISLEGLNQSMLKDPNLQLLYEKMMSQIIVKTQDHIVALCKFNTEQKLAFFLLDFQECHPITNNVRLPMGREDLASYLGVTTESLSRAFAFLERNQLVQVSNRLLTDLHIDGLVRLLA